MLDGKVLTGYLGKTFRRLIGEPLTAQELLALSANELGMYMVAKMKVAGLVGERNRLTIPLRAAVASLCPGLTADEIARVTDSLVDGGRGWIDTPDEHTAITCKSDNVTGLVVAFVIYNEGGWISIEGEDGVIYHPSPR